MSDMRPAVEQIVGLGYSSQTIVVAVALGVLVSRVARAVVVWRVRRRTLGRLRA